MRDDRLIDTYRDTIALFIMYEGYTIMILILTTTRWGLYILNILFDLCTLNTVLH